MNDVLCFVLRAVVWVGIALGVKYIAIDNFSTDIWGVFTVGILTGIFMYIVDDTLRGCFIKRAQ